MLNANNKTQLIRLLLSQWQTDKYATRLVGWLIYFVCKENCVCLTSRDGLTTSTTPTYCLNSKQEEADTRIVLHCLHAKESSMSDTVVVVRSLDTDVLIILVHYAGRIKVRLYFDTGLGNKRRMMNVQAFANIIGLDVCKALPAFHAFTGCDFTIAFVRRGKLSPFKLMNQQSKFKALFLSHEQFSSFSRLRYWWHGKVCLPHVRATSWQRCQQSTVWLILLTIWREVREQ